MALEEAFQVTVDEAQYAAAKNRGRSGVADQAARGRSGAAGHDRRADRLPGVEPVVAGADAAPGQPADVDSAARPACSCRLDVDGLEHLERSTGPVIFAANHQSHFDTPAILQALPPRVALPRRAGDGEGVLQGALLPGPVLADGPGSPTAPTTTWRRCSSTRSRCRSAKPAPGRRCAISASWSTDGYSVLIFPEGRRASDEQHRDVPAGRRDDCRAPRRPRRAGAAGRPRPDPPPHLEVPRAGAGRESRSARPSGSRAPTTATWPTGSSWRVKAL